jgi:hypothetical protein
MCQRRASPEGRLPDQALPGGSPPRPVDVIPKRDGQWPDREAAVTMKPDAVQGFLRECLGFERDLGSHPFDPPLQRAGANEAVTRAGIWSAQSTELVS